jgi:putative hydrolase of the HAD superfamily
MTIKPGITTLIFDFGGVIINLDLNLCIQNLKHAGALDVEKYLSNYGQSGFFLQWEKGEINLAEFRNAVRSISVSNPDDKTIDDAWCSFLQDIPEDRIRLLEKLKTKYRLLLLSNSNPLHIEVSGKNEFNKYGYEIGDLFEKAYISYELGLTKPDPAIFNYILTDLNIRPEECLFLDDGEKNIRTASEMGFETYLVTQGENLDKLFDIL